MVVEEMTGSSGSENSAIGAEPSKNIPTLQLSIGLRSVGLNSRAHHHALNLPDSNCESNLQKAGESASADKTDSSPTTKSPDASSQQVLSLVSSSISRHILHFLSWLVLHIQAPSLAPI